MRFFTTEGPVNCADHYCLPPLERLDLTEVRMLIDQQKYFAIHAPPRSGKTTYLLALAAHLNQDGRYRAVCASSRLPKVDGSDFEDDLKNLTEQISCAAKAQVGDSDAPAIATQVNTTSRGFSMLGEFLTLWCKASRLPIVLLLDDLHTLARDTLFALLRQLRSHHPQRPTHFPQSIILCGVHDIRDYGIHLSSGQAFPTGSSVFNIKAAALGLDNFRPAQVERLLLQHTNDTGQVFTSDARQMVFDLTQGQPWLVNALARQAVQVVVRDPAQPVDAATIAQAKELLIQRQDTHLDSLAERLREPRVRHVIEPLLAGRSLMDVPMDDIRFVLDLGLVRRDPAGGLTIANLIYREMIPRIQVSVG